MSERKRGQERERKRERVRKSEREQEREKERERERESERERKRERERESKIERAKESERERESEPFRNPRKPQKLCAAKIWTYTVVKTGVVCGCGVNSLPPAHIALETGTTGNNYAIP